MGLMGAGELSAVEREMVLFARHCEVCHTTDREALQPCLGCFMVSYCCDEHEQQDKARHGPVCRRLLLALRCMQASRVRRIRAASAWERESSSVHRDWATPTSHTHMEALLACLCQAYDLPPVWIPPSLLEQYSPLPTDFLAWVVTAGAPFSWRSHAPGLLAGFSPPSLCDLLQCPLTHVFLPPTRGPVAQLPRAAWLAEAARPGDGVCIKHLVNTAECAACP